MKPETHHTTRHFFNENPKIMKIGIGIQRQFIQFISWSIENTSVNDDVT